MTDMTPAPAAASGSVPSDVDVLDDDCAPLMFPLYVDCDEFADGDSFGPYDLSATPHAVRYNPTIDEFSFVIGTTIVWVSAVPL